MGEKLNNTPIYQMNYSDGCNNYYIKREDLLPFSFGGNKARKALLFFEEIERQGSDCVVTYGSSSSNHCRVIANMAASKGLPCHIISPAEASGQTYNSKMVELLGAQVTVCPVSQVSGTIAAKLEELKAAGKNPYFIQGGGHGNLGTEAYVQAYEEIIHYEKEKGIYFDYIFHASGTGTTQAGLICGMITTSGAEEKSGTDPEVAGKTVSSSGAVIIGISIARKNPRGGQVVLDSVKDYMKSVGRDAEAAAAQEALNFIDDYVLEGYGFYNNEILTTIREILTTDGIPLDPIYTGKAFYGMKEYIRTNQIRNKNILFLHTGGTPLFFDVLDKLDGGENRRRI
jgi:D-cysteine desulfhydrase